MNFFIKLINKYILWSDEHEILSECIMSAITATITTLLVVSLAQ